MIAGGRRVSNITPSLVSRPHVGERRVLEGEYVGVKATERHRAGGLRHCRHSALYLARNCADLTDKMGCTVRLTTYNKKWAPER